MSAPRGIRTSRSMIARRIFAWRPTRTPGIRMHCSMWQKLWTRTFGQSTLPLMLLPDAMQPREITEACALPARWPIPAHTNLAGGACAWDERTRRSGTDRGHDLLAHDTHLL